MTRHTRGRRRYRKSSERRVWVFSDVNRDLRPEQIARIITSAGLEQARLEAEAQAENTARAAGSLAEGEEVGDA
ncbi:hypothetical protein NH287_01230 [Microbacterium sp. CnD16-F]|uniref:hypothetical protein n=1 Tax=Microbacterium sp. CnD16-F TaxID=2954493 RepID=UPI002096D490|nr:hypothetical protein [Microbacterium sp. CnD16-F]MCO7202139.1 hypothetical protein [Microbacterium sp. CnD16-F]